MLANRAHEISGPSNPFIGSYVRDISPKLIEMAADDSVEYQLPSCCMHASLKIFVDGEPIEPISISSDGNLFTLDKKYADITASYLHLPIDKINNKMRKQIAGEEVVLPTTVEEFEAYINSIWTNPNYHRESSGIYIVLTRIS